LSDVTSSVAGARPAPGLLAEGRRPVVHIDCDTCEVRGLACGDCVITVLLGAAPAGVDLDAAEQVAIGVLADTGLVPPLRLRRAVG
jgi:hypothetical protein